MGNSHCYSSGLDSLLSLMLQPELLRAVRVTCTGWEVFSKSRSVPPLGQESVPGPDQESDQATFFIFCPILVQLCKFFPVAFCSLVVTSDYQLKAAQSSLGCDL